MINKLYVPQPWMDLIWKKKLSLQKSFQIKYDKNIIYQYGKLIIHNILGEEFLEQPIPEQFKTTISGGKLKTAPNEAAA